jgi:hypothetical protein
MINCTGVVDTEHCRIDGSGHVTTRVALRHIDEERGPNIPAMVRAKSSSVAFQEDFINPLSACIYALPLDLMVRSLLNI